MEGNRTWATHCCIEDAEVDVLLTGDKIFVIRD